MKQALKFGLLGLSVALSSGAWAQSMSSPFMHDSGGEMRTSPPTVAPPVPHKIKHSAKTHTRHSTKKQSATHHKKNHTTVQPCAEKKEVDVCAMPKP